MTPNIYIVHSTGREGGGGRAVMNNCNNLCIFSVISGIKIAAGHDVGLTLDLI